MGNSYAKSFRPSMGLDSDPYMENLEANLELIHSAQGGSELAKIALLKDYDPLVKGLSGRYFHAYRRYFSPKGYDFDDVYQQAKIIFLGPNILGSFDAQRGRFDGHAKQMLKYGLDDMVAEVYPGNQHQFKVLKRLNRYIRTEFSRVMTLQRLAQEYTTQEIAEKFNAFESKNGRGVRIGSKIIETLLQTIEDVPTSLESLGGEVIVVDECAGADKSIELFELIGTQRHVLGLLEQAGLSEKEWRVLRARGGIGEPDGKKVPMRVLGEEFGCSFQWIDYLHKKAKGKLLAVLADAGIEQQDYFAD